MATETDFRNSVAALDEVTAAFLVARKGFVLSQYEADRSAYQLLEGVFRNINAITGIAMMPKPGTHLIPSWVLLRSSFEIALTAYWLTKEDDWKEREARWLGWMAGEEEYQRRIASDVGAAAGKEAEQFIQYADRLEGHRKAIMRLLPKDSREKRPNMKMMLQECGCDPRKYVVYRIGSQLAHGGPTLCTDMFHVENDSIRLKGVNYAAWVGPFQIAGWCIAQAGCSVLIRGGVQAEPLSQLAAANDRLQSLALSLES